jgi:lipopolysaccharide biosynthesis glycosyltransferase
MHIVLSSDDNYAPLLGVAIYSLLENQKKQSNTSDILNIYIMDMSISSKNKEKILRFTKKYKCNIHFIDMSKTHDYLEKTIKLNVRSLATYYRLFLPTILPDTINKVIYMDCDSLINNSIDELWNIDIDGYDIAGVVDLISIENKKCIGLNEEDPYLNAGMLVINLAKWRKDNMEKQMIDFITERGGKVCYHDQGTINGVCLKKKILHPKYNAMTPFFVMKLSHLKHYHGLKDYYSQKELSEAKDNPVFCHFTPYLTDRPWVKGNKHPLKKLYYQYANQTPWRHYQFDKPSATLEPWVKWLFYILPYPLFIFILRSLQKFKPKTWIRNIIK